MGPKSIDHSCSGYGEPLCSRALRCSTPPAVEDRRGITHAIAHEVTILRHFKQGEIAVLMGTDAGRAVFAGQDLRRSSAENDGHGWMWGWGR